MKLAEVRDVTRAMTIVHNDALILRRLQERFSPERKVKFQRMLDGYIATHATIEAQLNGLAASDASDRFRQIKNLQGLLTQEAHRIENARVVLDGLDTNQASDPKQVLAEIRALPRVTEVGLYDHAFCVRIAATHEQDGRVYDLGDWLLLFPHFWLNAIGESDQYFTSLELRSGRRLDWDDTPHGPYHGTVSGGFCFGTERMAQVMKHVRQGNLLQAIVLAISYICDVNDADRDRVPAAFNQVRHLTLVP